MEKQEPPEIVPLVKALTKAPTLFGVPYMFTMANLVLTAVVFLVTKNLLLLLICAPIHLVGYLLTLRDDQIFAILRVKGQKTPPRSSLVWGVKSYSAGE
ncbi:type IV secretion system protein VirB3 [Labrys portucalensis]|uniref:Type IV secretion system protein VirB3 n=1 Tax=Labrys neptuniae TaxID=376174 RepID=A0ABV6ZQP1_9HYPH